ncbi:hypothetical protein [Archangium primigenium]|uniref:hypothetical protein n=1 Tax=[Archangium] primigenium TaxID=2792470 RepID=UPI00195E589C|nr:hypothetical protein [Archangium primigenium]MBM7117009.1 hypothetical protein [Archangium primigenium]
MTSACDDLSSAEVLEFGTFTQVTDYTDLPFPFALFGQPATRFVASAQGLIFLGGASLFVATSPAPQRPPDARIPNGWVAPFWDSRLTPLDARRSDVRVLRTGTGATERLVIGYQHFTLRVPSETVPNPEVRLSFQVALLRERQAIEFRYCQLEPGPGASQELRARVLGSAAEIGLESAEGDLGASFSFQEPLLSEGGAIRFTPGP